MQEFRKTHKKSSFAATFINDQLCVLVIHLSYMVIS